MATNLPEPDRRTVQGVTAAGIALVSVGVVLDVAGVETLVLALGVSLSAAGIVFLATPGDTSQRYRLAFTALAAGQLALFSGPLGLLGIIGLLAVGAIIAWLSLREDD
ncbi:hypothetical protein ACFQL3_12925 [Natronoarchaeum sp. GCM10025321]|uniref:hypothetical protein n=1 Tax=Natronoarchaeum sp. GCM10025321 TaxID=3252684 RepID=UPI00361FDB5C